MYGYTLVWWHKAIETSSRPAFWIFEARFLRDHPTHRWQFMAVGTFSVEPPSSTHLSFSCSTAGMLASVAVDRAGARTMFIMICSYAACSQFAVPVGLCVQAQST